MFLQYDPGQAATGGRTGSQGQMTHDSTRDPVAHHFPPAPRGPFKDVPGAQWRNWHWQLQHRVREVADLDALGFPLTADERRAAEATRSEFRVAITPYYAGLMDPDDPGCPVRLQALPRMGETEADSWDLVDPLAEERDMPVPGITHRYPDRVLFYISPDCAVFCRHCTRKRKVSDPATAANDDQIRGGIEYVRRHPEVRDVIVSGGDPLAFSDDRLEWILRDVRAIPHVEIIRVGTRVPVTMPHRITPETAAMLGRYHPLFVNTHFNHPKECTREAYEACRNLAEAGIPLGNQMVLLRGVNDDAEVVKRTNQLLLMMRVRPYYIYLCDLARGNRHFRTTYEKGLEIMRALRGWTSGLAVPYLVIDAPGGGGKVPILPNYVEERDDEKVVVRNFRGTRHVYYEPVDVKKS